MRTLIFSKYILLFVIILLGAFLRFYKLTEFPIHLNHDEITQLYDAISIAQTGKDIYGNFMPFIFPSVGDFKPPFYTYATSLAYFLFGKGELIIRLPGAIFGVFTIPAIYFFVLRFLKRKEIALFTAFFSAIAPFEIFFSRKSFENGAGILLILIGFLCIFKHFDNKKKKWLYFSALIFGSGIYTYFSHAIIIPLLLISFIFIYREFFAPKLKQYFFPVLLFAILAAPLILLILTNPDVRYRSQTVFISQDYTLGNQINISKVSDPVIDGLMRTNTIFTFSFNRYLEQFDVKYLFASGLNLTNQGLLGSGPLLLMQLPFLILGLVYLIKRVDLGKEKKFIFVWVVLGMLPSGLTFENHSPHRVVMVFTMFNIISGCGAYYVTKLAGNFRKSFLGLFILLTILNLTYFIHIYSVNFPYERSQYLNYPFKQVAQFAWSQYSNYDAIVFDPQFGDVEPQIGTGAHYYFAYYGNIAPERFQKEYKRGDKPREVIFDKFSIRQVYWPADKDSKKTLFIVSVWSVPLGDVDQSKIIKRFNFYDGKLAFYAISP